MNKIKEIIPYILIIITVIIIRTFIVTPVIVDGDSMSPTLENNEVLLLKKYDKNIKRFDIVVIQYNNEKLVKRIIGLPGERLKYQDSKLYINEEIIEEDFINTKTADFDLSNINFDFIPNNYYFVMGDNRNNSADSRIIGLINIEDILGTTSFALFPFNKFGEVK